MSCRILEGARTGAVGAGVGAAAGLGAFPELPLVNNVNVPPGNAVPGTPGGGGLPATATAPVLALVPAGLIPVAVFPPYATPRTLPADSVIFLENPGVTLFQKRKKRSILNYMGRLIDKYFGWWKFGSHGQVGRQDYYGKRPSFFDDLRSGTCRIVSCFLTDSVLYYAYF